MSNEDRRDAQGRGTSSGPSYHRALGRAQGLALAGGRVAPAAEDAFRGSLWEAEGPAADLMVSLGTDRRALLTGPWGVPMKAQAETVLASAEQEAIALGDGFVGSWHVVLALLAGEPDSLARECLGVSGITHDRYAERLVAWLRSSEPPASRLTPASGPTLNPACRELLGRAEALGTAAGVTSVLSQHALVAWLWEDHGQPLLELEGLGTTATELLDVLLALGVGVPAVSLPEPDRRPWGETVYFPVDRLGDVLARLNADLRPGDWGWNRYQERAWADAVAGIDLKAIVDDVVRTPSS